MLWIIIFDGLAGCLFLSEAIENVIWLHHPGPEATEGDRLVSLMDCLLDSVITFLLLGAGVMLLARSRAGGWLQRTAFWALVIRCGFIVLELFLPSDGLAELLRLGALMVQVFITAVALFGAIQVERG